MSDRLDYFYRQRVSEAELDLGFELLERADHNLATDIGLCGIVSGAEPAPHSPLADLTIDLAPPCKAYDRLGQRIFFGTGQRVDCSVDHTGLPTLVSAADKERWLGVFLKFDRLLSDPRTDGNSQQLFFRHDESFKLVVRQAPEGAIGSAPKVPLEDEELLICEVLRRFNQDQILLTDIDSSRRQVFVFAKGNAIEIVSALWSVIVPAVNTVQGALDAVDAVFAGHFDGSARRHGAGQIDYNPHGFIGSNNLQSAVDEVVDDLSSTASGDSGAAKVGADEAAGSPKALLAGTVRDQLMTLLNHINTHVGSADHDSYYPKRVLSDGKLLNPGESADIASFRSFPDIVCIAHTEVNAQGLQQPDYYLNSQLIRGWVTKVNAAGGGSDYKLTLMNYSSMKLYATIIAYDIVG